MVQWLTMQAHCSTPNPHLSLLTLQVLWHVYLLLFGNVGPICLESFPFIVQSSCWSNIVVSQVYLLVVLVFFCLRPLTKSSLHGSYEESHGHSVAFPQCNIHWYSFMIMSSQYIHTCSFVEVYVCVYTLLVYAHVSKFILFTYVATFYMEWIKSPLHYIPTLV